VCVSSELEEILKISERIAVTAGGQFAGEVAGARAVFKANCHLGKAA
jgi:ABC-type sugar transport system ATPase subunit